MYCFNLNIQRQVLTQNLFIVGLGETRALLVNAGHRFTSNNVNNAPGIYAR